ncbi:sulfite exporter TauE/SafE family protein [bacterium]|nr:sulfite exporter TauE/SafE family protein [bacterium]
MPGRAGPGGRLMLAAIGTALWLGILTSISPCPLATNVAAMGFIGRRTDRVGSAIATGLLYTAGRAVAYAVLGMLLVGGLLAVPTVSNWLQENMIRLLGPLLLVTSLFLLGLVSLGGGRGGRFTDWVQRRADTMGLGAAFFLGLMFALAFCPVSAALFFGSLLPVCLQAGSGFWLPLLYGVGSALPVLVFGVALAVAAGRVGRLYARTAAVERWARRGTGIVFMAVGAWFTVAYSLRLWH